MFNNIVNISTICISLICIDNLVRLTPVSVCLSVRPSMPETTALGAAMAAGVAVGVWSLRDEDLTTITTDVFTPATSHTGQYF